MAKQRTIYATRRTLRTLEKSWLQIERLINRLTAQMRPYNPLYHLGTLIIFLLLLLTLTGVYLTLLYRPGSERAYTSVVLISATWFGSLIRTIHRYASDALILAALLHAGKMLISDRFWGSRGFAWVSGWVLLFFFWLTGTMGYFLVWDRPAQWLTEYAINLLQGAFAYSFLGLEVASRTFSFFVIVLFLHVFIPLLLVVGILVHVTRLARAQYWSPRWLMILSTAALLLLALWRPVVDEAPADLGRLISQVNLDWWYLGFLPLIAHWGNPLFWSVTFVVAGINIAAPWLWRGRHTGPAFVIPANCTGCALCARECPYDAIVMLPRDDETKFNSIAMVKPHLCTGCGVCVGACADAAIELEGLHAAIMRQDLKRASAQAQKREATAPVVVFTCDRHATLGTLPPLAEATPVEALGLGVSGELPLFQAKLAPRVNAGFWPDSQGKPQPVMTCVTPCMGMLHPQWAAETVAAGAAGALMVTCPQGDCAFREGPHWVEERVKRRRTLRTGNTYILEAAPGSRAEVMHLWECMLGEQTVGQPAVAALVQEAPASKSPFALVRQWGVGFVLLLFTFGVSLLFEWPATAVTPTDAQIQLVINHSGQLMAASSNLSPEVLAKLPKNVDPAQVLGGERFPVQLQLFVDGQMVLEQSYRPRGLRREGSIYGLASWWVTSGERQVEIQLMDNGQEWQTVFTGPVKVAPGQTQVLVYDSAHTRFILR